MLEQGEAAPDFMLPRSGWESANGLGHGDFRADSKITEQPTLPGRSSCVENVLDGLNGHT